MSLFARTLKCTLRHYAYSGQECRRSNTCKQNKTALIYFNQSVYITALESLVVNDKQRKMVGTINLLQLLRV